MKLKIYQVDAFTNKLFSGNPAAVCIIDKWLDYKLMQNIALENNLSETAFVVPNAGQFEIKWFTPTVEIDLCGHATLAAGHVIFNYTAYTGDEITFNSDKSGILKVKKDGNFLTLDFPVDELKKVSPPEQLIKALEIEPIECYRGRSDFLFVYASKSEIENIHVDCSLMNGLEFRGLIITAKGKDVDFVSRFFAPGSGILEDPVTGSAHTSLTPYWSKKLHKKELTARQLSSRGGQLKCKLAGDRVLISGQAVTYMIGELEI
ncbi:MAG: PhzF family phenazine biosynthesis protein [Bacteroidales bacterium]|nr:PhzF family phenazine biosynthesis protein [Bacteroidales bacterium]